MAYSTVQEEGTNLTQRSTLNFIGDVVTATDNSGSTRTDVTLAAVKLQSSSPGTAQTGNFNIDTGVGRLAVQDKGGQVFNVKAYGAKGDGTTDDTTAISNTITAAAAVAGQVYFPHGTYKTTGDFDLSGKDRLTIRGAGIGSTKIELAHATNDLFKFGTGATPADLLDITIGDFSVTSETITRTGGWVLRGYASATAAHGQLRRSRIEQLDIKKQVNGIWVNRYEYVWLTDLMMTNFKAPSSGNNYGVRFGQAASANQGSEILMRGVHVSGLDFVLGTDPRALDYGFFAEDCDAIHWEHSGAGDCLENALKMIAGSAGCHNHFFDHFAVDNTKNSHAAWITGTGEVGTIEFTGCWFASAGRITGGSASASGLRIDITGSLVGDGRIVGCHFAVNNGSGLYVDVNRLPWSIVANTFLSNGLGTVSNNDHSIFLNLTLNETGPNLIGNVSRGANGADIRTTSTTNRLRVVGNDWTKAPTTPSTIFGVEPDVYVGNSDQGGAARLLSIPTRPRRQRAEPN